MPTLPSGRGDVDSARSSSGDGYPDRGGQAPGSPAGFHPPEAAMTADMSRPIRVGMTERAMMSVPCRVVNREYVGSRLAISTTAIPAQARAPRVVPRASTHAAAASAPRPRASVAATPIQSICAPGVRPPEIVPAAVRIAMTPSSRRFEFFHPDRRL